MTRQGLLEPPAAPTGAKYPTLTIRLPAALLAHLRVQAVIMGISVSELARERLFDSELDEVDFYEREFYPLSNFSAFTLAWPPEAPVKFDTSEAAYHWEKFGGLHAERPQAEVQLQLRRSQSAHDAFKLAESNKHLRRPDWDGVKVATMRRIIRAKTEQHEYVRRKLLETGDRPLIEGSWRDDFWGIGPNRDGQNMLGKLWMGLRGELQATASRTDTP